MTIQAAVIGATGYVGGELLRLISSHPEFRLAAAVSESSAGESIANVFPHLSPVFENDRFVAPDEWISGIDRGSQLALFSAAPHAASALAVAATLEAAASRELDTHVVDSSADFRFQSPREFEAVYGVAHPAADLLSRFSCGVPEHVTGVPARHIGHPGCFATAILLAAVPLYDGGLLDGEVFVSGTTGSTGSGRSPQTGTHHPERNSNMYAYKPLAHRHVAEIEALIETGCGVDAKVNFVPHSGPFARGIYVTLQAHLKPGTTVAAVQSAFHDRYGKSPFVRVVYGTPKLKNVVASNYAHVGIAVNDERVAVMCAIDNLVKGAAGGAVQWMNRLWSLPEASGLLVTAAGWT